MKRLIGIIFFVMILCTAGVINAAPGVDEQISLIAQNSALWKHDVEYFTWGYTVTDLDHNGRLEIISASVQGTGFYTYIKAFEVNEAGNDLTELIGDNILSTDSSPDIMVSEVPVYFDEKDGRYYYIFDDMIRNGMAEYYENKRAVSIVDGKWEETYLAYKTTIYTDEEHYTISCTDAAQNPISEAQYNNIMESTYGNLKRSQAKFVWNMTDINDFAAMTSAQLIDSLKSAVSGQ